MRAGCRDPGGPEDKELADGANLQALGFRLCISCGVGVLAREIINPQTVLLGRQRVRRKQAYSEKPHLTWFSKAKAENHYHRHKGQ